MEVIKNKKILGSVGIICLLLGTVLPYFTISIFGISQSYSLLNYWEGYIILVLTLANALFIFKDFIKKYVPQLFNNVVGKLVDKASNPKMVLIPTILVAAFAIYMLVSIDSEYIKYGLGFWTLWIGIVALIGHSIFYKGQSSQVAQPQQYAQQPVSYMQQPGGYAQVQQPMGYGQPSQQQPVNYQQMPQTGMVQPNTQPTGYTQPQQPTVQAPNNSNLQ